MQSARLDSLFGAALGWNIGWVDRPSETVFPVSYRDADGKRLHGANDYALRFPNGQLPSARYWRISLYDLDGFFCENATKRYGIGNYGNGLLLGTDDTVTIYIQHASPGESREINWLPAPLKEFFLVLRMYQPDERMTSDVGRIPPVQLISRKPAP